MAKNKKSPASLAADRAGDRNSTATILNPHYSTQEAALQHTHLSNLFDVAIATASRKFYLAQRLERRAARLRRQGFKAMDAYHEYAQLIGGEG